MNVVNRAGSAWWHNGKKIETTQPPVKAVTIGSMAASASSLCGARHHFIRAPHVLIRIACESLRSNLSSDETSAASSFSVKACIFWTAPASWLYKETISTMTECIWSGSRISSCEILPETIRRAAVGWNDTVENLMVAGEAAPKCPR